MSLALLHTCMVTERGVRLCKIGSPTKKHTFRAQMGRNSVVVAYIHYDVHIVIGSVGRQLGEERHRSTSGHI